jgi:hypothetical protein
MLKSDCRISAGRSGEETLAFIGYPCGVQVYLNDTEGWDKVNEAWLLKLRSQRNRKRRLIGFARVQHNEFLSATQGRGFRSRPANQPPPELASEPD